MRSSAFAIALILGALAIQPAEAKFIYTYDAQLATDSGPDTSGLGGATAIVTFDVNTPAVYVDRSSFAAIPASNGQVVISGATVAGNNGTYSLGALAFYPTFAGFFDDPIANTASVLLPDGNTLYLQGNTSPTPGSSNATIGSAVQLNDFVPAKSTAQWNAPDGTFYDVNASITATAVPEPASLSIMVAGLLAGGAICRRKKARKA